MNNSNPNGFNPNINSSINTSATNTINNLLNAISSAALLNNNNNNNSASSSQLTAPLQAQAHPSPSNSQNTPLSSSLPNSLSNSLNSIVGNSTSVNNRILNNIISVSSLASSTSSNSSSSTSTSTSTSSTVSHTNTTNDKMDTSFTSNDLNANFISQATSFSSASAGLNMADIISRLYPNVNQNETPLPRQWSTVHKCQLLNLSHGNLRVTYKGPGKTHKDAASVRTDYPIPAACGIYYYEVKIISKGRDGYMGIGLSKSEVLLNRLPGWDKNSYGYHGDDGHSFCCSGTGQNYGPTFTTGDIVGCCLNLIENTCFYTKNGFNLGVAFRDLPADLYPTVGLQTPMESVEANFGQYPFEFDIHNYVKEWHLKTRLTIEKFPLKKENENNLPTILRKLISTYLVHHGYSSTAEAFTKSVGHVFEEELASIRNRQRVQKSVMNGRLAEAIELTYQLFPGILEHNANLLFALKVRQFIEMINNATDANTTSTVDNSDLNENKSRQSTLNSVSNNNCHLNNGNSDCFSSNTMIVDSNIDEAKNGHFNSSTHEEEMDMDSSPNHDSKLTKSNEKTSKKGILDQNDTDLQRILEFGRELFQLNTQHVLESGENQANTKMLRDAFSLLAYHDPLSSPLGYQLDPSQREPISALLNSAILEANNMPRIPPLEVVYGQTNECMRLMSKYGIAWCAYVNLADYMQS